MRLIDADALIKFLTNPTGIKAECEDCTCIDCIDCIVGEVIENAPTITPESLARHGRWRWCGADKWNDAYECSECGKMHTGDSNYCPNCGARMDDLSRSLRELGKELESDD